MCVVIPFILDVRVVVDAPAGVTQEEDRTEFFPPSFFCGACLHFYREKNSAVSSLVDRVKSIFV